MKRKILTVFAIILFVAGLSLLLWPTVSNLIFANDTNKKIDYFIDKYSGFVEKFETTNFDEIDKIDNIDLNNKSEIDVKELFRLYRDVHKYNDSLKSNQRELLVDAYSYENPFIDLSEYGIEDDIFGYIKAESINMNLPIYLGCNDYTMACGAAHMCYTSAPIGGQDTNCVLASHTGYSGKLLFDNIVALNYGDIIEINTFFGKLTYEVSETSIVDYNDSSCLYIEKGKDLLTLMTCISDGNGGFDRYLVKCIRN